MIVADIRIEDGKYVGYYRSNAITRQTTLAKALTKLAKYVKSQG